MTSGWSLRQANGSDRGLLFDLHRASMGSYVEELYGPWDDEAQWDFFDRWFRPENTFVVVHGGDSVGVVGLEHRVDEVYVTRIEVHPDSQNQGIGTAVLRQVLQEAGEAGKAVSLHVFEINPARRLYERLGFRPLSAQDGRILMKAIPPRGLEGSSEGLTVPLEAPAQRTFLSRCDRTP